MHKLVYTFALAFIACSLLFSGCKSKEERELEAIKDSVRECSQVFADSFFNLRYLSALKYCTPESRGFVKFLASNVSQSDLATVAQCKQGATATLGNITVSAGRDSACIKCSVKNFLNWDSIGCNGKLTNKDVVISLVKRSDSWKVDLTDFDCQLRKK